MSSEIMRDVVFLTPAMNTPWLELQQSIINKLFPESLNVVVDTNTKWWIKWFDWIPLAKQSGKKYYVHIDEDCFLLEKSQLIMAINMLEQGYDLIGTPDADAPYRGCNNIAMNSFMMIGRVESLENMGGAIQIHNTPFDQQRHSKLVGKEYVGDPRHFEPYYGFFWHLLNEDRKFKYLHVFLDDRFDCSTVSMDSESDPICMHMWYCRQWQRHAKRYAAASEYLKHVHQL